MKQAVLYQTGGPDSFQICEMDEPEIKQDEILVRVDHAGVAFADVMMRHGVYPKMPKLPFAPGYDICGIVLKTGVKVSNIKIGDKVIALTQYGGYSQLAKVHCQRAIAVPNDTDSAEAAALVLNYISAYQMLTIYVQFKPGQKILIHSAAGGVGTAATQIAKAMGLKVYGTCSAKKAHIVEACGATPIDYQNCDFVEILNEQEPGGVDVVLDPIGGPHWVRSQKVLRPGGILIGFGFFSLFSKDKIIGSFLNSAKYIVSLNIGSLLPRAKKFKLYSIRPNDHRAIQESLRCILDMYLHGKIKPVIYQTYPLEKVSQAHFDLANSVSYGKIVLSCQV